MLPSSPGSLLATVAAAHEMLRFARVLPGSSAWVRCTLGPTAVASWGRSSAVAVRRGVCTCGGVRPRRGGAGWAGKAAADRVACAHIYCLPM